MIFFEKTKTVFKKLLILLANFLGLLFILAGLAFLLVGVYHTAIFVITKVSGPVFLTLIPTATLIFASGVIFLKQPVHNLLCLIAVFFNTVLLYLYVGSEFLAFLFLIVYVGAIAILFLFVIMLLHLKEIVATRAALTAGVTTYFIPTVFVTIIGIDDMVSEALARFFIESDLTAFVTEETSIDAVIWFVNNRFSDILLFSEALYTYHAFLFFLSALLLLTAMLGAIILATSATDSDETHSLQTAPGSY